MNEKPLPPASYIYDAANGYKVRFTDFGFGGIKIELFRPKEAAPWWDTLAAAMLPADEVDGFLLWMASTVGRAAFVMPENICAVLSGVLAYTKGDESFPRSDRKVIRSAVRALKNLYEEQSLAMRAINR